MVTEHPFLDHRARFERMQFEAAQQREQALVDQSDPGTSPEERVRAWERLHQLRLPRDPSHAILPQVAEQTALALEAVLEVMRLRALPRAP